MNNYLLIGNPNVGKTTIFNSLTGSNERVSNFEGVTVSKKENIIKNTNDILVDLPGTNNLNDSSLTSIAVNKALINDEYEGIIYVSDTTNVKKNMYLLLDVLESGKPLNLFLNMTDLFNGEIKEEKISDSLNVNIYKTNKNHSLNFKELEFKENNFKLDYGNYIEEVIEKIISLRNDKKSNVSDRFIALQVIKGNSFLLEYFDDSKLIEKEIINLENKIIEKKEARSLSGYIFKKKREYILKILDGNYKKLEKNEYDNKFTNLFDKIALHKIGGYILFAFVMWVIFLVSFKFSFLQDITDGFLQVIFGYVENFLININASESIISFMMDGVLSGLGAIIVFLPQIIILFFLLTVLEGSGYLSRVSVLFENLFNKMGLSANSLIPLISGLGCNVLSVISTRNIKSESKRISTILASPFISCSARFPVYLIFIDIFFEKNKALILLLLYILGIIVAILVAYVTDKIVLKNKTSDIAISYLPSYKIVGIKYLSTAIINKIKNFLLNAGKLIFIGTIVVWVLTHFSLRGYTTNISESILYNVSSFTSFLFVPLGFGTVEATSSLFAAFFAKELAISAMVVMYSAGSIDNLNVIISQEFTVASALSFMIFTLLYIPCISTLGAIYAETKKVKIVIASILISLTIAYVLSFIVFNIFLIL